jgi:uncharacterized protein (DUF736 family)
MSNEAFNNTGRLFRNDRKKSDKQPDFGGDATIDGVKFRLAAWAKESNRADGKWLSIKFETESEYNERIESRGRSSGSGQGTGGRRTDDIPF